MESEGSRNAEAIVDQAKTTRAKERMSLLKLGIIFTLSHGRCGRGEEEERRRVEIEVKRSIQGGPQSQLDALAQASPLACGTRTVRELATTLPGLAWERSERTPNPKKESGLLLRALPCGAREVIDLDLEVLQFPATEPAGHAIARGRLS